MTQSRRDRTGKSWPELLALLKTHSYQSGRVVLASGMESDFFIDCKQSVLKARGHQLVGELMLDAFRHVRVDAVAGVELGGCPLASAVSFMSAQRGRPLDALYVRKEVKDHGSRRKVEGLVHPGMRVMLLEDVITTGGSTLRALDALRSVGAEVLGVVALVDRLEGGVEAISAQGVEVVALFTRLDFLAEDDLDATLNEPTVADE
ncbi:MAG: orotate phosphoribosyltransferase [Myxococcales bacterium]|nr:orotate phosphoribosyltransferase [Myxococcales bacterium]